MLARYIVGRSIQQISNQTRIIRFFTAKSKRAVKTSKVSKKLVTIELERFQKLIVDEALLNEMIKMYKVEDQIEVTKGNSCISIPLIYIILFYVLMAPFMGWYPFNEKNNTK